MRFLERPGEAAVELLQHGDPVGVVLLDLVELRFHLARVADVHQLGERFHELGGDDLAEVRRVEPALHLLDVLSLLDDTDDLRVRRWAADALRVEGLNERRLRVARRG